MDGGRGGPARVPNRWALTRYALAMAAAGLALGFTLALEPWVAPPPLDLFYGAVAVAAWLAGLGPALLTGGLSAVAIDALLLPADDPLPLSIGGVVRLTVFVGLAALVTTINTRLEHARGRAEQSEARLRALGNARLSLEAERARRRADAATRARDEFLATVSHELRTPLNTILGWVRLLGAGALDAAAAGRALETIERTTKLQARIIDDLLDASRIMSGQLELETAPVRLDQVVDGVVEGFRPAAAARGLALEMTGAAPGPVVSGDPSRLAQVVGNLLSNALEFTPPGGRVTVEVGVAGAQARVAVTDTGQGIDPELLPHVFDRFGPAAAATTRAHHGRGLGLAIVAHLVALHGGRVEAESRGRGTGTRFTVWLPLEPAGLALGRARGARVVTGAWLARGEQLLPQAPRDGVLLADPAPQERVHERGPVVVEDEAVVHEERRAGVRMTGDPGDLARL
jgi:signal transduction histidine kinase